MEKYQMQKYVNVPNPVVSVLVLWQPSLLKLTMVKMENTAKNDGPTLVTDFNASNYC